MRRDEVDEIEVDFEKLVDSLSTPADEKMAAQLHESMVYLQRMYRQIRTRGGEVEEARMSLHTARLEVNGKKRKLKALQTAMDRKRAELQKNLAAFDAESKKHDAEVAQFARFQKELKAAHEIELVGLEKRELALRTSGEEQNRRGSELDKRDAAAAKRQQELETKAAEIAQASAALDQRSAEVKEEVKAAAAAQKEAKKAQQQAEKAQSRLDKEHARLDEQLAKLSEMKRRATEVEKHVKKMEEQKKQAECLARSLKRRRARLSRMKSLLREAEALLRSQEPESTRRARKVQPLTASLVMVKENGRKVRIPIVKTVTVLGRGEECDLIVPVANVSRRHCRVELRDERLWVRDLKSTNGTQHNDQDVQLSELSHGDTIAVGPVRFTVLITKPALHDTAHAMKAMS